MPSDHDSPRVGVLLLRAVGSAARQSSSHFWKFAAPAGIDVVGVFELTPWGRLPNWTTSWGIVMTFWLPLPTFHSPKAMVLLAPSVMSRRPMAEPPNWSTPLGGPPVWVPLVSKHE